MQICAGEEYLPAAPNPEDIVWDDGTPDPDEQQPTQPTPATEPATETATVHQDAPTNPPTSQDAPTTNPPPAHIAAETNPPPAQVVRETNLSSDLGQYLCSGVL